MYRKTVAELASALATKAVSSTELTQLYLDRISAHQELNAFITVDADNPAVPYVNRYRAAVGQCTGGGKSGRHSPRKGRCRRAYWRANGAQGHFLY